MRLFLLRMRCNRVVSFFLTTVAIVASPFLLASSSAAQGPTPGNLQGRPPYVPFDGDQIESVDMSSGNLHIEIPVYSESFRGKTFTWKWVYDTQGFSATWVPTPTTRSPTAGYYMIQNPNTGGSSWRFITPYSYTLNYDEISTDSNGNQFTCQYNDQTYQYDIVQNFSVSDPDGTQHPLNIYAYLGFGNDGYGLSPCGIAVQYVQSPTLDGSGMYFDLSTGALRLKDGTLVAVDGQPFVPSQETFGFEDANGNISIGAPSPTNDTGLNGYSVAFFDAEGVQHTTVAQMEQVPVITADCTMLNLHETCNDILASYGDTQIELQSLTLPNGQTYSFQYNVSGHSEMTDMTLPTGASVAYTYGPMYTDTNYTRYSTQNYHAAVSTRKITSDGVALPPWQYNITGAFPGQPTVLDPSGNCTQYNLLSLGLATVVADVITYNGCNTGQTLKTVHTDYGYEVVGGTGCSTLDTCQNVRPIRVTTTLDNGLSSKVETDYEMFMGNDGVNATRSNPIEVREYDYGATTLTRVTDYTYLHNPAATPESCAGNSQTLSQLSSSLYVNLNIVDKPTKKTVCDGAGNLVAQTNYEYDDYTVAIQNEGGAYGHDDTNFGPMNPVRGNLTATSAWNSVASSWLTSRYQYDDLGNIVSVTDPMGNTETISYADRLTDTSCKPVTGYLYSAPTLVTNALGQTTQANYSSCTGIITQIQDSNDLAQGRAGTQYTFDSVNNLTNVSYPDSGRTSYNFNGYANPLTITSSVYTSASTAMTTTTRLDGRGRKSVVTDPAGAQTVTTYDNSGRVYTVSNPYYSTADLTYGLTTLTYDSLNRKLGQLQPDGSSLTWQYTGATVDSWDEAGVHMQHTSDALGRLTQVAELGTSSSPLNLVTKYKYDPLNNLKCVDQLGGTGETLRHRDFSYDSLSRLISSTNPETGTIGYTYDANSNLQTRTDANSVTTTYNYDALNRLTSKSYSDGKTIPVVFGYDDRDPYGNPLSNFSIASNNSVGRLSIVSNDVNAATAYSYDAMGRIVLQNQFLPGVGAWGTTISAGYDLAGNMTGLTYPDGTQIQQGFDGAGRIITSNQVGSGGSPIAAYLNNVSYLPDSSPGTTQLGNGVNQTVTKNNRLQVSGLSVGSPLPPFGSNPFLSHTYSYGGCTAGGGGNNGNICGITDTISGSQDSQAFTYDSLNRINTFSLNGTLNQQFNIDSFGNMCAVAGCNPATWFNSANQIANLPCSSVLTPYDAAGNQQCSTDENGAVSQYSYDAENRIASIALQNSSASPFATYVYGADGARVRKTQGLLTDPNAPYTEYVNFGGQTIAERDQTGNWTDYIYANGKKIAKVPATDTRIRLSGTTLQSGFEWGLGMSPQLPTVATGDQICWRQYNLNVVGGLNLQFSVSGGIAWNPGAATSDGQEINQDYNSGGWQNRCFNLSQYVGQTIQSVQVLKDLGTPVGSWSLLVADLTYIQASGGVVQMMPANGSCKRRTLAESGHGRRFGKRV